MEVLCVRTMWPGCRRGSLRESWVNKKKEEGGQLTKKAEPLLQPTLAAIWALECAKCCICRLKGSGEKEGKRGLKSHFFPSLSRKGSLEEESTKGRREL